MRFYTKTRRKPTIVIVSLIDILAILLIFFIVSTTFKRPEPQVMINLPESKTAEEMPARTDPAVLYLKDEENIEFDGKRVTLEDLEEAIREVHSTSPDRPLTMQADENASFGLIIAVLDAFKGAGVENIPAFTRKKE